MKWGGTRLLLKGLSKRCVCDMTISLLECGMVEGMM